MSGYWKFRTENCASCYIAGGVLTGCNPDRKADELKKCGKCGKLLPPRGEIVRLKMIHVRSVDDGESLRAQLGKDETIPKPKDFGGRGAPTPLKPAKEEKTTDLVVVARGYVAKIKREADGVEEWYVLYLNSPNELFTNLIGEKASHLQQTIQQEGLIATWPNMHGAPIPFPT